MTRFVGVLLLAGTLAMPSCARLEWARRNVGEPITTEQSDALVPGEDDLGSCLALLGAPDEVFQTADEGVGLVWGWIHEADWGFSVSYSIFRFVSVSFQYGEVLRDGEGVVLFLDRALRLQEIRRGALAEILDGHDRRRPPPVDVEG